MKFVLLTLVIAALVLIPSTRAGREVLAAIPAKGWAVGAVSLLIAFIAFVVAYSGDSLRLF